VVKSGKMLVKGGKNCFTTWFYHLLWWHVSQLF